MKKGGVKMCRNKFYELHYGCGCLSENVEYNAEPFVDIDATCITLPKASEDCVQHEQNG